MINLETLPEIAGVYFVWLPSIEKGYVGESNCIKNRIQQHLNNINGKKTIRQYHKKYGNTEVTILKITNSCSLKDRKEVERQYKAYFKYEGINLINKLPSDVIENEWFNEAKPILQYDLKGNFLKEYPSILKASKILKFDSSSLSKACRGIIKSSKGFLWFYKENFSIEVLNKKIEDYEKGLLNVKLASTINVTSHSNKKPISQFTKEGVFIKNWDSLIEVQNEGIARASSVSSCLKGRTKTSGGYIWKYAEESETVN